MDILTFPNRQIFQDSQQFMDIMGFINDSTVLFNFDPSQGVSIDRRLAFHSHQGQHNESYSLKMKYDLSEPGFFRNIFGLEFAEESLFDLEMLKTVFEKSWESKNQKGLGEGSMKQIRADLKRTLMMEKDICYHNQNINLLFEFLVLNKDQEKYKRRKLLFKC